MFGTRTKLIFLRMWRTNCVRFVFVCRGSPSPGPRTCPGSLTVQQGWRRGPTCPRLPSYTRPNSVRNYFALDGSSTESQSQVKADTINQSITKSKSERSQKQKKCLRNYSSRTWTFLQPRNNNEKQIFLIGINLQPNGKLLLKPTAQLKVLQTFPLNNILIWNTLIYKVMLLEGKWADWNCVIIFSEYDN